MIFVTVGSQTPFDRLVKLVDSWAGENPDKEVFAQVGASSYCPKNMKFVDILTPADYERVFISSDLIVSHAGMGTIISALQLGKPLLVMARNSKLGETRNDHQIGTARRFENYDNVFVVRDDVEFGAYMNQAYRESRTKLFQSKLNPVSETLVCKITEFIDG